VEGFCEPESEVGQFAAVPAEFRTKCQRCGGRIEPGEGIRKWRPTGWAHAERSLQDLEERRAARIDSEAGEYRRHQELRSIVERPVACPMPECAYVGPPGTCPTHGGPG